MKSILNLRYLMILGSLAVVACGGDESLVGDTVPNTPPDTEVTSTPPVLGQTSFSVEFFWKGFDPDGEVMGFEWRISDNGRDGMVDPGDTLTSKLPWNFTQASDSVFVVTADLDSFLIDVGDPNQNPRTYRYWQTHTFFIRAVDSKGARDPSPANVSFTATTLAPTVNINLPPARATNTCVQSAKVLTFGWEASDPDNITGDPESIRYILKPVKTGAADGCYTQIEYENANPPVLTNDDPLWSPWIRYDAPNDAGKLVTLDPQQARRRFLFAVQARDVAGAVTPTFDWNRNVRHIETSDGKFPVLQVCETFLGCENFVSRGGLKGFEIVSGQPIEFSWNADATEYAGVIDAYRYGWNVADPDDPDDPGWIVEWGNGPSWKRSLPRVFTQGSPVFVVQCRDNSGTVSRAVYQFQVIQVPERVNQRNLLLVDDWRTANTTQERILEQAWDNAWDEMLGGHVVSFTPNDVLDAQDETSRLTASLVMLYKSVIWFTNSADETYFHTRLAPIGRLTPRYNWVEVYQKQVGNLLIAGPGSMYNSLERPNPPLLQPIVYNIRASGNLGFGTLKRADGTEVNVGTLRWPYSAWCLEATDYVRPAPGLIYGEQLGGGNQLRTLECDQMYRVLVADEFIATFPDAEGVVRTLEPSPDRVSTRAEFKFPFEEFYNVNVTTRQVPLDLRSCQVPMYRMKAKREALPIAGADTVCTPRRLPRSPLDLAPVGVVSSQYSDTKPLKGSEDFLWGFHPLGFDRKAIQDALLWILESRWQIPVQ